MREGLGFRKRTLQHLRTRYHNTMTDHSNRQNNQQQVDSRSNLFYLLERLSGLMEAKDREPGEESSISHEQTQTHRRHDGIVS
jgi:hypothetical protein